MVRHTGTCKPLLFFTPPQVLLTPTFIPSHSRTSSLRQSVLASGAWAVTASTRRAMDDLRARRCKGRQQQHADDLVLLICVMLN